LCFGVSGDYFASLNKKRQDSSSFTTFARQNDWVGSFALSYARKRVQNNTILSHSAFLLCVILRSNSDEGSHPFKGVSRRMFAPPRGMVLFYFLLGDFSTGFLFYTVKRSLQILRRRNL